MTTRELIVKMVNVSIALNTLNKVLNFKPKRQYKKRHWTNRPENRKKVLATLAKVRAGKDKA